MAAGFPQSAARPQSAFLDPVAELQLRRWARLNHVALADRDPQWHPVVWAEMAARDRELVARPVDVNGGVNEEIARAARPRFRVDAAAPAAGPRGGRVRRSLAALAVR